MTADELLDLVRQLDDDEMAIVADLVRSLDEARMVVSVGGDVAETTARNPKPEKR